MPRIDSFYRLTAAFVVLLAVGLAPPCWAEGPEEYADFSELDLESLLNQTITTASKYEQKVSESPVAATVITSEEIAASGASSIPEVLYRVPGLDIIQSTSTAFDVSARGLNKEGSNTMLVMIDGRAVYLDLYSITPWDQLPVSLEDIKVIEVILGPGSVMYGANAFAGVINIITFSPDEKSGTTARVMASDLGEIYGSMRHAGRSGATSWKLNTAWNRADNWEKDELESEIWRFEGRVAQDLDHGAEVALSGGITGGESAMVPSGTHLDSRGNTSYIRADYSRGNFEARWYLNSLQTDLNSPGLFESDVAELVNHMHDLEIRHSLRPADQHILLLGGSYRHQRSTYSQEDGQVRADTYAAFLHDEWRPSDRFNVSAGLRYDNHPQVGGHWAPRGGLVFNPGPDHALRLTFSRAYRDPTYIETYWRTEYQTQPGFNQIIRGDEDIQSETISALEIGYQGLIADNVLLHGAIFRNEMDELISPAVMATFPPPFPEGIPSEIAFQNIYSWTATGGEAGLQTDPRPWLRVGGSYSYVWMVDSDTDSHVGDTPVHHAHVAAIVKAGARHRFRVAGRYRTAPPDPIDGILNTGRPVDDQLLVDVIWNLTSGNNRRLVLGVRNLFDERVRDSQNSIEHRRRAIMSATVDF